jgi:hypothetical protein
LSRATGGNPTAMDDTGARRGSSDFASVGDLRGAQGLRSVLARQAGVVTRAQLRALHISRPAVETMLRRRELVPVHPGVYVDHTGVPSPVQRRWAAVLYAGPAALHLAHALPEPPDGGPVDVAVDWTRRVATRRGVRVHRVRDLEDHVRWNLSPPRVRIELATIIRAEKAATDADAIAVMTAAVGSRLTTAGRLRTALAKRRRVRRRSLLTALLDDLAAGTHSLLEHGFLTRVVRPHGLPEPSRRQSVRRGGTGTEYRDVEYADQGRHVELDGRAGHDNPHGRDRDADRDLDDEADGLTTVRLRWRQVFGTPCRTAERMARILRRGGWTGRAQPCGPSCLVATPGSPDPS